MPNITEALMSLRPNSAWVMIDEDYNSLEWQDTLTPKPTKAEIDAEVARLQAEYDAKQYQRDRAEAYPSIADQLDTLYHGGYDAWKATIEEVKNKYPKVG